MANTRAEADRLASLGIQYARAGNVDKGMECCAQAIDTYHRLGDWKGAGRVCADIAAFWDSVLVIERSIDWLERAVAFDPENDYYDRRLSNARKRSPQRREKSSTPGGPKFSVGDRVRCAQMVSEADQARIVGRQPRPGEDNQLVCVAGDEGVVVSYKECVRDPKWQKQVLPGESPHLMITMVYSRIVIEGVWVPVRLNRLAQVPRGKIRLTGKLGEIQTFPAKYLAKTK
jgi:hypothetical protein